MDTFFKHIPDTLFSPLTGQNRHIYAHLIMELHALFFEQAHGDVFPSYNTVRAEIEEQLLRFQFQWQDENEDAPDAQGNTDSGRATQAYQRLQKAGWLEEEQEAYEKSVTVPPAVAVVWNALLEIARPTQVVYGGMVLSIYNNLNSVFEHPEAQALAFRQAVNDAKRFRQHLTSMVYALKGVLAFIAGLEDQRQALQHFFEHFVGRILVQDYNKLKTQNNPFRFRLQILEKIRELEFDTDLQQRILNGYLEQTGLTDRDTVWEELLKDTRLLRRIFEEVEEHLDRIDRYRAKVERRVADIVRYLDRSQPGMANHVAGLLQDLGEALRDLSDDDDTLVCLPIAAPQPLSIHSLQTPRALRKPAEPRPLKNRIIDPAVLERQKKLREYMNRRRIDPKRIVAYLEQHLGNADYIAAEHLPIQSVEDFIAFTHIRYLAYLPGAHRLQRAYRIERSGNTVDNEFLSCPGFTIYRR